jgi:hypothetical protein
MAGNSRSQSRNGQRNTSGSPSQSNQENTRGSRRNTSGLRDTNLDRVRNDNRTPKNAGISEKRYISGSDYDGQLSDE